MSYEVLARKWRPQTFADLVGQNHVVKALTYALEHQQIHHAYLFTGTRGVGKTSIARIFAKSLNCETNGVSATPCGQCTTCQEIAAGKFVDLIEVDAASRTGVEETRELIESVAYLPSKGRYKVYLIDEVHMFSKSSFNALLKTLEEPPEHVKFILATTDPEKLPITILSRCLQFNLKSLTNAQICQHLANICDASNIPYDEAALTLLASAGDGSMRDTLSMTDQAIAYGRGELRLSAVTEILGTIQPNDIEAILFAIATNNPNQLSQALHRLDDYEVDARAFLIEIMRRLQRMAWAKEGIAEQLSPALQSTINDIPKPLLHLWYDIAEKALPNLAIAGDPRQAVEMALLRMLAFIPEDWVVRHRTLLETDSIADIAPEPSPATVQPKAETQTQPVQLTEQPEAPFAQHVEASPVTAHDSLAEAEAEFSGEPEPMIAENKPPEPALPAEDISGSTPTASDNTPETNTPSQEEDFPQSSDVPPQDQQKNWHLSSDIENVEMAPSMDDVRSLMQSGRDIAPPPTDAVPTPMPQALTETEQAQPMDDTPPWEALPEAVIPQEPEQEATPLVSDEIDTPPIIATESPVESVPVIDIANFDWYTQLPTLGLSDYTHHLASLGILRLENADSYINATLNLPPKHELLITESSLEELSDTLEKYFATPIKLQTQMAVLDEQTPQERDQIANENQQSELLHTFTNEPLTQQILNTFEGKILENKVNYKKAT